VSPIGGLAVCDILSDPMVKIDDRLDQGLSPEVGVSPGIGIERADRLGMDFSMMGDVIYEEMKKHKSSLSMLGRILADSSYAVSKFRGDPVVDGEKIGTDVINIKIEMITKIRAEKLFQDPCMSQHEHSQSLSAKLRTHDAFLWC